MQAEQMYKIIQAIDHYNSRDPRNEEYQGDRYPQELLYSERMTNQLKAYAPKASPELQIAARAQHIGRWEIPRDTYLPGRKGYLKWRNSLKMHHANTTAEILRDHQIDLDTIARISATNLTNSHLRGCAVHSRKEMSS